jgi:Fe-S-cluster containining protein
MEPLSRCIRCGTCCKKGGPAIHIQDKPLIDSGKIAIVHLFTIRCGEPAYDNIKNHLTAFPGDIVKIKNQAKSTACIFYEEKNSGCRIYRHRPIECKVLKCWDTRGIEALYEQHRINRSDLMGNVKGLWELVSDHQNRCDYGPVLAFVNKMKSSEKKDRALEERTVYILQYDLEIRKLAVEKGKLDPAMIDFLLGRPILDVLCALGMKMQRQNGKIVFSTGPDLF